MKNEIQQKKKENKKAEKLQTCRTDLLQKAELMGILNIGKTMYDVVVVALIFMAIWVELCHKWNNIYLCAYQLTCMLIKLNFICAFNFVIWLWSQLGFHGIKAMLFVIVVN